MSDNYGNLEPRVTTVEEAVLILKELALSAHERMNGFDAALSNLTVKIEALTDAQIRNEESFNNKIEALADAQRLGEDSLSSKIEALTDAQIRNEESFNNKIEALADAMAEGQRRTDEALARLADAQARMADAQAHTDQRLDALIDIVRGRNGQ